MNTHDNIDALTRSTVVDRDGDKVGGVGQVFLDDNTGHATWVTVNTGFFGTKETFVPLQDATIEGEQIRVPYEKKFIKDAPNVDVDQHLSAAEEEELYRYYNLQDAGYAADGRRDLERDGIADVDRDRDLRREDRDLRDADRDLVDADRNFDVVDADRDRDLARDRDLDRDRNIAEGDSVVAHEERLNVGTERREAGRARLRKHVVTDTQNVEVPVQREELHVDREDLGGKPTDHRIGEDTADETVTLYEERPVVSKETVATERVGVSKETVSDTENVQADVRHEEIEVDEDLDADRNLRDGDLRDRDLRDGDLRDGDVDRDITGDKRNPLDRDGDGKVRAELNPFDRENTR